MKWPADYE